MENNETSLMYRNGCIKQSLLSSMSTEPITFPLFVFFFLCLIEGTWAHVCIHFNVGNEAKTSLRRIRIMATTAQNTYTQLS